MCAAMQKHPIYQIENTLSNHVKGAGWSSELSHQSGTKTALFFPLGSLGSTAVNSTLYCSLQQLNPAQIYL